MKSSRKAEVASSNLRNPSNVDLQRWLTDAEQRYGGLVTNVPRNKVSTHDPRTQDQLARGGMAGGDRMHHHGYASRYAEYLAPFVKRRDSFVFTLAEFGILSGIGLAIWCELFDNSRIIGLDIDLGHIEANMADLKDRGAFASCRPELYEYDQFEVNPDLMKTLLHGDTIDICIDDGYHSNETILNTLESVYPYLSEVFVYFIEDNPRVHKLISSEYPDLHVDSSNELTILTRKQEEEC